MSKLKRLSELTEDELLEVIYNLDKKAGVVYIGDEPFFTSGLNARDMAIVAINKAFVMDFLDKVSGRELSSEDEKAKKESLELVKVAAELYAIKYNEDPFVDPETFEIVDFEASLN